jgi:predicted secreted protein
MAAENRIIGKDVAVSFQGTDIRPDFTSFTISSSADLIDVTAADEASRYYIAGVKDATMSLEAYFDGSTDTVWDKVVEGAAGTLIVSPAGTATGKMKLTWDRVIVKSRDLDIPFDNGVKLSVGFQASGTVTEGVW